MTDWIMTASGRPFWPLAPRREDVRLEDIAHHLSHLCRFTGAVREFYSVAQHSVLASFAMTAGVIRSANGAEHDRAWIDRRELGLYGLLHDAAEAYLCDLPRPLKHTSDLAGYRSAEAHLAAVIYLSFGLAATEPVTLKTVDRRLLRTEQRDLMPPPALDERRDDVEPYPWTIKPWPPAVAREAFLERWADLTGGCR